MPPKLAALLALSLLGAAGALTACGSDSTAPADAQATDAGSDVRADTTADAGPADADADTPADTEATDAATDTPADTPADTGPADTAHDTGLADAANDTGPADAEADAASPCTTACDCPQGTACVDGSCDPSADAAFCCTQVGCPPDAACVFEDGGAGVCGVALRGLYGQVVINEVLTDGETDGDPNGDGEFPDAVGDEFVELVNVGASPADLSGLTLVETTLPGFPRHTFPAGTTLAAGHAYVVFGGGTAPEDTTTATFAVANAQDPGTPFGLSLDNDGDTLQVLDADGALVARFAWGPGTAYPAVSDQSYTRSPDLTGDFIPHGQATADPAAIFSPGTRADGSAF